MTRAPAELLELARAWMDGDPDPATRAELGALVEASAFEALAERLQPLSFGTAGLRGAVGAGSGRMNLAVVMRTAHGIARYLTEQAADPTKPIVIGFDARPTSRAFAEASAGVLLAAGRRVVAFTTPTATPLCAFLGRELGAPITIVVTASHNPRPDNGYKVYGANAVQIVAPVDVDIARHIAAAPAARAVPKVPVSFSGTAPTGLTLLDSLELDSYFAAVSGALPAASTGRELAIVHSALHGVGSAPMLRTLADAGFMNVHVVPAQAEPDGTFPTTPFPNPEEPGTLDLALAEAERRDAALLLVNDPDADRLAAAARLNGALTVLDGNQVGALLADHLLSLCPASPPPLVLTSIVSSPFVSEMAKARGGHSERTHTGFKWLWTAALDLQREGAARFCFAYEEALGYSVFPAVRDKDGIAAGRALAELAAALAERGKTLFDRLHELYAQYGLWASAARNLAFKAGTPIAPLLDALVAQGEVRLGARRVVRCIDYRAGDAERPAWLGAAAMLELRLDDDSRLFVRPSGTEPKLKLYGHVKRSITLESDLGSSLAEARQSAAALLQELATLLQR
ncbi:MAG TPA: phospho-sugar mutase [Polyangiaceae bacterium]|nr:phospho-sugar mutase [Polyangiaceae bacterium]